MSGPAAVARRSGSPLPLLPPGVVNEASAFADVPALLAQSGRLRGFERLRDLILERYDQLGFSAAGAIKAALEVDRHALFSEVAEDKMRSKQDHAKYDALQEWLSSGVGPVPGETAPEASAKPKPRAAPLVREGEISGEEQED